VNRSNTLEGSFRCNAHMEERLSSDPAWVSVIRGVGELG
jgi:hypothetical protein